MTMTTAAAECGSPNKPNARFDHVYAIIRLDDFLGPDVPAMNKITIKKVMRCAEAAEAEAKRLNDLRHGRPGVHYFVQITRLEREERLSPLSDANGRPNGPVSVLDSGDSETIEPLNNARQA